MTYVKICGLTNLRDAEVAADAGADLLGFIFAPSSPRYVEPPTAREVVAALRPTGVRFVGVFVDEPLERALAIGAEVGLDLAQLHGNEPVEYVRQFGRAAFKALRPRGADEARLLAASYAPALQGSCPAVMIDAYHPRKHGGTGQRADWLIAAEMARQFPLLLAGGLDADNVAEAVRAVRPWGVDVSSGVERSPGQKDPFKIEQFIRNAKRC